jgi:hypothetical protein
MSACALYYWWNAHVVHHHSKKDQRLMDQIIVRDSVLAAAWMDDVFFLELNSAWSKVQSCDAGHHHWIIGRILGSRE